MMVQDVKIFFDLNNCVNEEESYVELVVYDSPEEIESKIFMLKNQSSIGRKNNNTLCFNEDLHMSNLHCKINLIGNNFIFEDMASTNGSWMRLSLEGACSEPYLLTNDAVFKIGNTAMYKVGVPLRPQKMHNELNTIISKENVSGMDASKCVICWDHERDCLIMPCKHNASCIKCTKSLKSCPICRNELLDILKIYKP
jgi:hypothetical protein